MCILLQFRKRLTFLETRFPQGFLLVYGRMCELSVKIILECESKDSS